MGLKQIIIGTTVFAGSLGLGVLIHNARKSENDEGRLSSKDQEDSYVKKKPCGCQKEKTETQPLESDIEQQKPSADEFPLRLGSQGKRVERFQIWLMRNYGWEGKVTAKFDQKTLKRVQKHLKSDHVSKEMYFKLKMNRPVYE